MILSAPNACRFNGGFLIWWMDWADNGCVMINANGHVVGRMRMGGMTLVELSVVIVVLGVIASIGLPLIGSVATSQLRSAVELLEGDLAYAQIESIAHSDDLRVVVFDAAGLGYSIATTSDTTTPITNPVGGQPYRVTFGERRAARMGGVSVVATDVGDDDELGFGAYGQLDQTEDATITLSTASHSVVITVEADTGETTIGAMQ